MSQQHNIHHSENEAKGKSTLSDEQLMAYMEAKLNAEEMRQIEELMSEDSAEADAIEGLQMYVMRGRGGYVDFSEDYWGWIAIVIILLLIVVGYLVIRIASK